jgi:arylsulfatase
VTDIAPTLLDIAGVEHPSAKKGSKLAPPRGKSMKPLLEGKADTVRGDDDWIGWELFGNRAIRQGDWKLVYLRKGAGGADEWKLYNLREDPAELRDLSSENPDKKKALLALWDQYVKQNGVIVTGDGPFKKRGDVVGDEDDD